jgi:hypothetical protein
MRNNAKQCETMQNNAKLLAHDIFTYFYLSTSLTCNNTKKRYFPHAPVNVV